VSERSVVAIDTSPQPASGIAWRKLAVRIGSDQQMPPSGFPANIAVEVREAAPALA